MVGPTLAFEGIAKSFGALGSVDGGSADLLPRWAALLVLLGYAAILALVGRVTSLRRDVA